MSSSNIAVSVRGLSKEYQIAQNVARAATAQEAIIETLKHPFRRPQMETFHALKDVSFDIQQGDVVGIIGRNGAGKSTLLKILSRVTEPTAGKISLYGRVGSLLEVGTGFHPELTGRENIFLNGAILGMSRREITKQFDAIVDFAGTQKFLDTPVKRYSSGMYVRLAFAVAAHLNPEILIVDEVLAVGDSEFQKKCIGKMKDVAASGRTILFVSHNLAPIQQLCNTVLLLRAGVLSNQGPTEEVVNDYMSDSYQSEDGNYDISYHPARSSTHEAIIRRVNLYTGDGKATSRFVPDDALIVDLTIKPTAPIKDPRVAVAIEDGYGRRLFTMASYFNGGYLPRIDNDLCLRCTLPKLNLGSGRYLVSVSVCDGFHMLDSVDNAAWIEVEWNNNFGNGEPYNAVFGPVLTNSNWEQVNVTEYEFAAR